MEYSNDFVELLSTVIALINEKNFKAVLERLSPVLQFLKDDKEDFDPPICLADLEKYSNKWPGSLYLYFKINLC